jgi:hypothetical protein
LPRTEKTARPQTRLTHAQRLLTHLDVLALLVGEVAEDREDGEAADEAD